MQTAKMNQGNRIYNISAISRLEALISKSIQYPQPYEHILHVLYSFS